MSEDDIPEFPPLPEEMPESADNVIVLPGGSKAELSEDKIALSFTEKYADTLKFDHDAKRWYEWDGARWKRRNIPVAFHYAREIARSMSGGKKTVCKSSVAAGVERFAMGAPEHRVESDAWDQDPWLLGTPSGTLDLRTGKLLRARPEHGITKLTGCSPDSAPPPLWMEFISEVTRGDEGMMTYLQRIAGYCLTGITVEQSLFFLYGPGGNGKGVFLNTLLHVLGDYAQSAPMATFTASKFDSHPTELARLRGARLVTASETEEGRAWAEARIKELTGGDTITARFMRADFFEYKPQFKLAFMGNSQPTLTSVDDSMRRRMNMLSFVFKPLRPDHMLPEKLKEEAPRILGWALRGCLAWQKDGLARPDAVISATNEYFEEQDVLGQWLKERCEVDYEHWEIGSHLFADWQRFARAAHEDPGTAKSFASHLRKRGIRKSRTASARTFSGLRLKPSGFNAEPDPD